ncbi:LytTR family DNA-binding domain-containing protein [Pontimicrobium sp. IMCC45349]|uniref:LytTR family DNA-binding domain-containing protein n=1 Tax=Pontimicrobium sp. IMCC45349 TaxID=3391574 RepID=UPI0039A31522
MTFLNKQIPFIASLKDKLLVGFILGCILAFIIIFLQPFDTNNYESNYKNLILSGFGILFFSTFFIQSSLENILYNSSNKIWTVGNEIISTIIFFTISGTIIYLYNHRFINGESYSIKTYFLYLQHIVLVFIPIFSPLVVFLRNKFGELIIPLPKNTVIITGENKNETLKLNRKDLLYIKAVENYIDIFFVSDNNTVTSKTFRQTLLKTNQQLPFLVKCHRSYLLNMENVKEVKGNSQNAKICFKDFENTIPLSKTYYTKIKSSLNEA